MTAGTRERSLLVGALALVTLVGLALRLAAAQQSLFGDELWSYSIVTVSGIGDVFDGIELTENTPPLYYVLAWLSAKLGDAPAWTRLPSVLYSTAAIPISYLLANRLSGARAGTIAALLVALAPFAVYYGSDARAYAGLLALLPLATYALLRAAEGDGQGWWVLFWAATTGAIYTHYSAIFVVVAQGGWALFHYRERWRPLLLVLAAVGIAYLPWIANVGRNPDLNVLPEPNSIKVEPVLQLVGGLGDVSGPLSWTLLGGAALLVIFGTGGRLVRHRRSSSVEEAFRPVESPENWFPRRPLSVLLAMLIVITPLGVAIYTEIGSPIFNARSLTASLPYVAVAAGVLLAALKAPLAAVATAVAALGLGLGTLKTLTDERRPPWKQAAEFIEADSPPGATVYQVGASLLGLDPKGEERIAGLGISDRLGRFDSIEEHPLFQDLAIYLSDSYDLRRSGDGGAPEPGVRYFVAPASQPVRAVGDAIMERDGATLRERQVLEGSIPLEVSVYESAGR